ncbi:MAG: SUMF1/EgtB/PvdO family nonheme iron enzyme [Chloroflexi bacterium]|nr:SUMF1/EgtB/PvdO family nonheme iron enzyme [Chloroflexota bacterium]
MTDPATLAAIVTVFGPALIKVLEKLADKLVVDPTLGPFSEQVKAWTAGKYNKKKAEADLLKALQASLPPESDNLKLFLAFSDLKSKPDLAAKVAAATVEMTSESESNIRSKLLSDLKLDDSHRRALAAALFSLRKNLAESETYRAGIAYADALEQRHLLAGLYESVEGLLATVTDSKDGKALRVVVVAPPPDQRALESRYLTGVKNENAAYALYNEDDAVSPENMMQLERVYIALNTTEKRAPLSKLWAEGRQPKKGKDDEEALAEMARGEREQIPVSSLRVVMESRRVMLLGEPGSGKSTFAQHLALCLAGARLNPDDHWPKQLTAEDAAGWELASYPFPVFIRLRNFARDVESLPDDPKQKGTADHLLAHLKREVARLVGGDLSREFLDHFLGLLESGDALVILDGLDEVSHPNPSGKDADRRRKVAQAIAGFAYKRFHDTRLLVTCRVKQYPLAADGEPSAEWRLPGLRVAQLAPFDDKQIARFAHSWFAELYARGRRKLAASSPENEAASLLSQVRARADLQDIAHNPMLLTLMAVIHSSKRLPETLIKLYEQGVEHLLWEWERLRALQAGREGESAQDFIKSLGVDELRQDDLEHALEEAVFEAHKDRDPEIPKAKIERALRKCFALHYKLSEEDSARPIAIFIARWLRGRNGLILPASGDESFTTPHKTLREFLAARYLHRELHDDEGWQVYAPKLVRENYDNWRDVFRFAAGLSVPSVAAVALDELCPEMLTYDLPDVQSVLLSAEVARDLKASKLKASGGRLGKMVYQRLESHLFHLMRDTDAADTPRLTSPAFLSPKTRLEAGLLLDSLDWTPPDLYDFVPVFETADRENDADRNPPNSPNPLFLLARYPVTNVQYSRFLAAEDYDDDTIWQAVLGFDEKGDPLKGVGVEAWKWFQGNGGKERKPRHWDDPRFGASRRLLPVVGVTWYEAAAYCVWLQRHWVDYQTQTSNSKLPISNLQFRLPTEGEWVSAAGGEGAGKDKVRYAWQEHDARTVPSDNEILMRANTGLSELGGTTPVCMYLAGMSLAGIMDMSGNVWEWQANYYGEGNRVPALRGGAWDYNPGYARVASRGRGAPDDGW